MKLVKSLLLGSAAGLFAVAGAQAADLPVRKAAPVVDYVRVCSAYGTGFFFIPGTETCLRISGRVRAEYVVQETFVRGDTAFNWRARAQLNMDARTQTAYGTLRTFIRYELTRNVGSVYGAAAGLSAVGYPTGVNATVNLDKAFIQFAGITAGRATSFFDFYATAILWGPNGGSDTGGADPVLLAYTASFGSGFSASISLEDPTARRAQAAVASNLLVNPATGGVFGYVYDADPRPHLVGQLRIEQAWGTAQLAGAVYQLRAGNVLTPFGAAAGVRERPDTEYGFAINAGLKINLPMLAAGDQLWLQASYSNGNANYLGLGAANQGFGGFAVGGFQDAFINAVNGDIERTKGFSLTAAFLHYWTPQIRQGLYANWRQVDVPGVATAAFVPAGPFSGPGVFASGAAVDFNRYELGTNLIWSPVAGLDIGVEVLYTKVAAKNGRIQVVEPAFAGAPATTVVGTRRSEDAYQARLRIQRDF